MKDIFKFLIGLSIAIGISVAINTSILYTIYDESVDERINLAQSTTPSSTTTTRPSGPYYETNINGLGEIIGHFDQSQDVLIFDNVPFAAPPIGERRFQRPAKFDYPWAGVYNATGPVSWCLQAFEEMDVDEDASHREDCLHLSVYVPRSAFESDSAQLPVYLYFHGGAYLIGSSAVRNGAYIAATQNIIVITANYRLGVFGFWFHSTFDSSSQTNSPVDSGNQGLYDQQMAMEWTREHIGKFAGNPNALTIGGMSAGGQSVQAHSVMASSAPLYDRMISLSGPTGVPYKSADEAAAFYEDLAGSLGCCGKKNKPGEFGCEAGATRPKIPDDFRECLLNKTTTEVQRAAWKLRQLTEHWTKLTSLVEPYCPTYGSWALNEEPFYSYSSGAYHDKPMIVETANNEGWNFVLVLKLLDRGDLDVSPVRWVTLMNTLWGADDAAKVLEVYACPCMDESDIKCDCRETADTFLTDYTWYCNARYAFTKGLDVTERSMPLYMTLNMGTRPETMNNTKSTHGIGEFLFFGSWRDDMNTSEAKWAKEYQNYVANFIRTGNPNDWTDNPNQRPTEDEFVWVDFQHNREWLQMGHLTFDRYDTASDIRFDRCAMLDEMGQYMKH